MACGVHLGILLICFIDHVCCLWATEAQSSQSQNGNRYVGISQQDVGPGRPGGNYPQNQLRQAYVSQGSAQSSSLNTNTAVSRGYSRGLFSSGYPQALSQSAQGGYASVVPERRAGSKPNWRTRKLNRVKVPTWQLPGLATPVASGGFVSQYNRNQDNVLDNSKKRTWPVQHGTPRASKQHRSSASAQRSSKSYPFTMASHQSAAQKARSASAKSPVYNIATGSSSLFSAGALAPQTHSVRLPTSGSAPARRVSSRRRPDLSKPSCFSPSQNERTRSDPSQTEAAKPYQSRLFTVNRGHAQGSSKSTSTSNMAYSQLFPVSSIGSVRPGSLEMPTSQRLSYKPSYASSEQITSSTGSLQASWNSRNSAQGARNLPAFQRFVPTKTLNIPQCFGGYAIRRLKKPDQEEEGVQKPQQTYTARSWRPASPEPHVPSKLLRIRPSWTLAGAAGPWPTY
ncbi:uncharacterized protein LOC119907769 [Micropterus salmoides]|uniref:uncharacterized protein LOC119907769 n=1 Tax=Micropterus salmoides TaxID=27706 RepID=UPI0018EC7086|nr:uncharacterized protein LOC119907769 [Micropterus salmoides]